MSRGPDAATLIERALVEGAARARCAVVVAESEMTRWVSATFAGARHRITLAAAWSDALDVWIAGLPEAEFRLRGCLVADVAVARVHRRDGAAAIELELLTVEVS